MVRKAGPKLTNGQLDKLILGNLDELKRPVQVASEIGVETHRVAGRIRTLVNQNLVERVRPESGPANGPGSSMYRRV